MIKLKGLSEVEMGQILPEGLIHLGYRGSISHGTYVPKDIDDKDILGVYVAPLKFYLGFGGKDTREKMIREWDAVHHEISKFIRLLLKSNPNVLSVLWLPEKNIIMRTDHGDQLREQRHIFASKKIYHSFTGYAYSQLKRMTHWSVDDSGRGYMGEKRKRLCLEFGTGKWKLHDVQKEAERLFTLADEAYLATDLPNEPDREAAEELLMNIIRGYHNI